MKKNLLLKKCNAKMPIGWFSVVNIMTKMEAKMDLFWIVFILAISFGTIGYGFFIYELFVAVKNEIRSK